MKSPHVCTGFVKTGDKYNRSAAGAKISDNPVNPVQIKIIKIESIPPNYTNKAIVVPNCPVF
jgi:hypothetical protein